MSRDPSDSKDEPQKPTEVIIDESSSDSDVVFVENIEGLTDPGHPSEGQTGQVTTGASASQESSEKADTPQSQSALGECPSPPTVRCSYSSHSLIVLSLAKGSGTRSINQCFSFTV